MARKVLLVGGVLSSLLYVIGIDVIAALAYPDYHHYADQMVSELFAVGAPTRTLMVWLSIPYNFLVFVLAIGVWASAGGKRATRFTAAALVGYGAVSTAGLLLFPMDVRGTVESQRDALHIIATIVMSMFIVAVMAFGAFAHGTRFRLYSFATIATVIVFGACAGLLARPMPGSTPWLGLAERVNIYATMLWMAVLAVCFLRVQDRAGIRRFGSTRDIAIRIADAVRTHGNEVDVRSVDEISDFDPYDAVVFGSGVYDGSWTAEATDLVRRHAAVLARKPVWLFSVGSFGDRHPIVGGLIKKEPKEIGEFEQTVRPRDYRVFAGVIDLDHWPAWGRLLFKALGGRAGDNRQWPDIDSWAEEISREIRPQD